MTESQAKTAEIPKKKEFVQENPIFFFDEIINIISDQHLQGQNGSEFDADNFDIEDLTQLFHVLINRFNRYINYHLSENLEISDIYLETILHRYRLQLSGDSIKIIIDALERIELILVSIKKEANKLDLDSNWALAIIARSFSEGMENVIDELTHSFQFQISDADDHISPNSFATQYLYHEEDKDFEQTQISFVRTFFPSYYQFLIKSRFYIFTE